MAFSGREKRYGLAPREAKPGYEKGLSEEQRGAVTAYTRAAYAGLNESLRDGRELDERTQELAENLDAVIEAAGTYDEPVTVFRGLKLGSTPFAGRGAELAGLSADERKAKEQEILAEWAAEEFPEGMEFETPAYQSTSFGVEAPLDASGTRGGVMWEILARSGAYLGDLSEYNDEDELLMPRKSKFRVLGVIPGVSFEATDGSTQQRLVIQLEQIP